MMQVEQAFIGQIVKVRSSLTNEGILYGHISGLTLNCVGEVIAEVTMAVYTSPSGEKFCFPEPTDSSYTYGITNEVREIHFSQVTPIGEKSHE